MCVCVCVCVCDTLPPQFKVLMEHLDPDEEDEEGEASASANIRNKAINALLGGSGPATGANTRNQPGPETDDDDSEGDERTPGVRREDTHARTHAHFSKMPHHCLLSNVCQINTECRFG